MGEHSIDQEEPESPPESVVAAPLEQHTFQGALVEYVAHNGEYASGLKLNADLQAPDAQKHALWGRLLHQGDIIATKHGSEDSGAGPTTVLQAGANSVTLGPACRGLAVSPFFFLILPEHVKIDAPGPEHMRAEPPLGLLLDSTTVLFGEWLSLVGLLERSVQWQVPSLVSLFFGKSRLLDIWNAVYDLPAYPPNAWAPPDADSPSLAPAFFSPPAGFSFFPLCPTTHYGQTDATAQAADRRVSEAESNASVVTVVQEETPQVPTEHPPITPPALPQQAPNASTWFLEPRAAAPSPALAVPAREGGGPLAAISASSNPSQWQPGESSVVANSAHAKTSLVSREHSDSAPLESDEDSHEDWQGLLATLDKVCPGVRPSSSLSPSARASPSRGTAGGGHSPHGTDEAARLGLLELLASITAVAPLPPVSSDRRESPAAPPFGVAPTQPAPPIPISLAPPNMGQYTWSVAQQPPPPPQPAPPPQAPVNVVQQPGPGVHRQGSGVPPWLARAGSGTNVPGRQ